ncbi:TetR family transcriptional regulator C-terminal domain-containing protein [Palleronia sp. KMU-117]|uniref:TetR family transcriptional regulator C-terminal domain-containing protein n=1 Tax=Palleronia sp. KMU-117 TaxID=3434108 RepID=UPI003D7199D1
MPASAKRSARNDKATPRTASKEVRRRQLVDATITSIARHGIGGTTMTTVTELAGLSLGIVNFHFQSKQKLLEETLVFLAREHHDLWEKAYRDADLGAPAKLLAIVDAHFHPRICTRKKLSVWYAFFGEAGRRAVYRALVDGMDSRRIEVSTRLCARILAEGGYDGPPAHEVAGMLEALYDGFWLNMLMYPGSFTREGSRRQIHLYLGTVFPRHFHPGPASPAATNAPRKEKIDEVAEP